MQYIYCLLSSNELVIQLNQLNVLPIQSVIQSKETITIVKILAYTMEWTSSNFGNTISIVLPCLNQFQVKLVRLSVIQYFDCITKSF